MKNKENFRTRRDDGDDLGERNSTNKVTSDPAPEEVDHESENTPPENEVYVDLEPDELHDEDDPLDVGGDSEKQKPKQV
ncbi:hypothetical protein [Pontibacter chitinilyticus]|uniref:hypothetical protein n=1 Tax=Pontibacter chitinilyticus TaxID=2674989 RepID=UPI0032196B2C